MTSPFPLKVVNKDLMDLTEISNSITSKTTGTVSEEVLEQIICYNLVQNTLPLDLSNNIDQNQTLTVSGGKEKMNGIMISNNDDVFDSELLAMKLSYTTNAATTNDETYTYSMGNTFSSTIVKKGTTVSYENSALKITVDFNNDIQYSLNQNDGPSDWNVQFTRDRDSLNNYFAAVNSNLNTSNGSYPMYIEELTSDDYIVNDGRYISSIDGSTNEHIYSTFNSSYSLSTNNLDYSIVSNHSYESSDFTMYKLVQDSPTVTLYIDTDASNLPISTSTNTNISDVSLSVFESNVATALANRGLTINDIKDGFKIEVYIADDSSGGFNVNNNDILTIGTNNIKDSNAFTAVGIRSGNEDMYIDITNGSLDLSGNDVSSNVLNVGLTSGYEHLDFSYNTQNGTVSIYVEPVNSRVYIYDDNNLGSIVDTINVFYNCTESLAYDPSGCSVLDNSMKVNPAVQLGAGIVVPTTDVPLNQCFTLNDNRNFKKSGDTALVISNIDTFNANGMPTYSDVSFVSNISDNFLDTDIVFITVTNKNVLAEDTPLTADDNSVIQHSLSSVIIQNMELTSYIFDDYKIRLDNKRISVDLSNSTQPTNGWSLASTNVNDFLVSNPIKTSILYDDCLFMRSGLDTSFNYTFSIATPTVNNAQSIKHRIDICFNDVDVDASGNPFLTPRYAYLDDNDITYSIPSVSDVSSVLQDSAYTINNGVPSQVDNKSKIIIKRVTSTVTYTASFEPKLPFYTNIKLQSPTITETVVSYKLYDNDGNELPDMYLKYFKDVSGNSLSLVNVSQSQPFDTVLQITPQGCSTLKATLLGSTNSILEQVPLSSIPDLDPFFNTESVIDISGNGTATVTVQVTYPTILDKEYYMIDTTNKPGEAISFETTLYKYSTLYTSSSNNSFDAFSPYNSSWVNLNSSYWGNEISPPSEESLRNVITLDASNVLTLTIYNSSDDVLATIRQPNTIINDFNIIRCIDPLVITYNRINYVNEGWSSWNTNYTTAVKKNGVRSIYVADGIYIDTPNNNPSQYSYVEFSLNTDEFSVQFVDGYSLINNGWDSTHDFTDISHVYVGEGLELIVHSNDDVTRSVVFDKYRGYNLIVGGDNITIVRTSMTAVFTVVTDNSGVFTQTFTDFANNGTYVVNNAVNGNGDSFDLGLEIYGSLSLMQNSTDRIYIDVQGASIYWVFQNTDNSVYFDGNSTLLDSSFPDLFGWKPRRIFSNYYFLSLTYNIPDVKYYTLDSSGSVTVSGANLYGNPVSKAWDTNYQSTNLTVNGGFTQSGIEVYRNFSYVENGFTAYLVVTPPQMKLNYNLADANVIRFPYNPSIMHGTSSPHYLQKIYYLTIDSDSNFNTSYSVPILPGGVNATFTNNNLYNIQKYKDIIEAYNPITSRFVIVGNYIAIEYYSGTYNSNNTPTDYIFAEYTIDQLLNEYNEDKLQVSKQSGTTIYDVNYSQFIGGNSGNQNSNFNIKFSISDAFLAPPPSGSAPLVQDNSLIISLAAPASTVASFYQSNIKLVDSSFVLVVDKYETSGVNYNALNVITSEVFFVVTSHWTSSFSVDGSSLPAIGDGSYGDSFDVTDLFRNIQPNDIEFVEDISFTTINTGLTLSALSSSGITNLTNLISYDTNLNLLSKTYYINSPDILRVNSMFGLPVYRVTNYGNVKTPSVTAYAFNIVNPTQLYDVSGSSIMNPVNNGTDQTAIVNNIQKTINTIPNAPGI